MKRLEQPRQFKVLVLISLVYASWRNVLNGIIEFSASRSDWNLRLAAEPGDFLAPQIEEAERAGYSGIILASPGAVAYERLAASPIPLVVAWRCPELDLRRNSYSSSTCTPYSVCELGLRHLMAGGRRTCFGFVRSNIDNLWPLRTQEAFVKAARAAGRSAVSYEPPAGARGGNDRVTLRDWLLSLPKPAAVMADTDRRAADVIAACHDGGLNVPDDVSVLGVDNDIVYALNTHPALSSVAPPHKQQGYRIAAELDRLMRAKARGVEAEGRHVLVEAKRVVVRESTRSISAADVLARRIAEFVDEHANGPLEVTDVILHLNCSRRYAEQAFRKAKGRTIGDYIADRRIEEVKRRLTRTDATVAQVSEECGFSAQAHLTRLFRRRTGLSPAAWRRQERG